MTSPQKTFETLQEIAASHSWKVFPNALGSVTISKGTSEVLLLGTSSTNRITHVNIWKCSIRFNHARYDFSNEGVEVNTFDPAVTNTLDYESAIAEITDLFKKG